MADKEQALPTWIVFGAIGVVSFIVFLTWALARMSALGDREDR